MTNRQLALYQHVLKLLTVITDNRNGRLDSARGSVPGILWFVLIIGGGITLGYPACFAASNLMAQILMTASLAALVALSLLLGLASTSRLLAIHISQRLHSTMHSSK